MTDENQTPATEPEQPTATQELAQEPKEAPALEECKPETATGEQPAGETSEAPERVEREKDPFLKIKPENFYQVNEEEIKGLSNVFQYHAPIAGIQQAERYESIRYAAKILAFRVSMLCPESREKHIAMTKLQECVMFANAAIAINERAPAGAGQPVPI